MISKELLKGTLRPMILKLLSENNKLYGYEITQKVKEQSHGKISLTFGALYPILHKLEADGIVKAETENVDNRLRKYYSLTIKGQHEAKKRIAEFQDYFKTMKQIFNL